MTHATWDGTAEVAYKECGMIQVLRIRTKGDERIGGKSPPPNHNFDKRINYYFRA